MASMRWGIASRMAGVIALANLLIILQHAAKRRHGQEHAPMLAQVLKPHVKDEARLGIA
jgi:hypothetical protein